MLGTTFRGDYRDEEELHHMDDLSPDGWVGEIIKVPHPASGHMGESLAKVISTETTTRTIPSHLSELYEEDKTEVPVLHAADLITGKEHKIVQGLSAPRASFAKNGAEYTMYAVEHKNGAGEWVKVSQAEKGYPWHPNQFLIKSGVERYEGHEETRIVERSVTYERDPQADTSDSDGYTLNIQTKPVTVSSHQPSTNKSETKTPS